MRKPPPAATRLLLRVVPHDETLVGDLIEEYESGRSRWWYWRQVLAAVVLLSSRHAVVRPGRTLAAVATGWATLLLVFFVLGDRAAESLAASLWSWDRQTAYATQVWWPFQISAVLVSYSGFALSALAVARSSRRHSVPMLLAYAASIIVALIAAGVLIEFFVHRDGAVPVPHTLFYVVSVALPYQWRSGLLLAPLVILVAGLVGCPTSRQEACNGSGRFTGPR